MFTETKRADTQENPVAQGTGGGVAVVVYPDRVELGGRSRSREGAYVRLGQIACVRVRGLINCSLTIEVTEGRPLGVDKMALPDARQIKAEIEHHKRASGLWE